MSGASYVNISSRTSLEDGTVRFRLANGKELIERRFIPMSKTDSVKYVNGSVNKAEAWVKLKKDKVKVNPAWKTSRTISINGKKVKLIIKEIETAEELAGYQELTRFHYRGKGGVGRRIPLIAKISAWNLPEVVGFVELSCSLIVNVARKEILNRPFHDPDRKVSWEKWDFDAAKQYCNTIARISRCVVFPELRGLGVAAELARAVSRFADERWHVAGLRPCFIEITAEMLRYWPFVKKYGYVYVGETQGNKERAPDAMQYLLQRDKDNLGFPQGGGGIMTMHRGHAARLAKLGRPINEIINLLRKPSESLSRKDWLEIHDICRRKKPTYMLGLTPAAKKHIKLYAPKVKDADLSQQHNAPRPPKHSVLASVTDLRISTEVKPKDSKSCRQIQEAFGIVSRKQKMDLLQNFSAEFCASEITLITGASGAGKSLLLNSLCHLFKNGKSSQEVKIKGKKTVSTKRIIRLTSPPREKAPIELFPKHNLEEAMRILAQAGLAEAHLFVRPARTLSVGQSYRLSLAVALSKNPDIILIDEFCEFLDEYTTAAICRKIRQLADSNGLCVIVATAYTDKVRAELRPNKTLLLLPNGTYQWVNQKRIKAA